MCRLDLLNKPGSGFSFRLPMSGVRAAIFWPTSSVEPDRSIHPQLRSESHHVLPYSSVTSSPATTVTGNPSAMP